MQKETDFKKEGYISSAKGTRTAESNGELTEKLLRHLLVAALGMLLCSAELLFGVRPFGIGLAAAAGELLPSAAAGVALYCLIYGDYLTLGADVNALGDGKLRTYVLGELAHVF